MYFTVCFEGDNNNSPGSLYFDSEDEAIRNAMQLARDHRDKTMQVWKHQNIKSIKAETTRTITCDMCGHKVMIRMQGAPSYCPACGEEV